MRMELEGKKTGGGGYEKEGGQKGSVEKKWGIH